MNKFSFDELKKNPEFVFVFFGILGYIFLRSFFLPIEGDDYLNRIVAKYHGIKAISAVDS